MIDFPAFEVDDLYILETKMPTRELNKMTKSMMSLLLDQRLLPYRGTRAGRSSKLFIQAVIYTFSSRHVKR